MGQATSSPELPAPWLRILPKLTGDDILRSSKTRCRVTEDKRVYLDDEIFDLDEHVPLALQILSAHPHLKDVRFKLVPGRMAEEKFWAALFAILNDGVVNVEDETDDVKIEDDYETSDEMEMDNYCNVRTLATEVTQSISSADESNARLPYLEEIHAQQELISRLQKSLREANDKIRKLCQKHDEEGIINGDEYHKSQYRNHPSMCPRCNSKLGSIRPHSGKWEMHPDCKEFLKLDDHLKRNLREEKEKRLNEVVSQMKFILDTDEMKDTYGKWSCCGQEEYDAEGCEN